MTDEGGPNRSPVNEESLYERVAAILDDARSRVAHRLPPDLAANAIRPSPLAKFGHPFFSLNLSRTHYLINSPFPRHKCRGIVTRACTSRPRKAASVRGSRDSDSRLEIRCVGVDAPSIGMHAMEAALCGLERIDDLQCPGIYAGEHRVNASSPKTRTQIGSLLFDRLSKTRDAEQVRALAQQGQELAVPSDVLKDPFVLEFLDLREANTAHERNLKQAIINGLEEACSPKRLAGFRGNQAMPRRREERYSRTVTTDNDGSAPVSAKNTSLQAT